MPIVPVDALTRFCESILEGAGVPRHKAAVTAACLVAANLRGVDSHGIHCCPSISTNSWRAKWTRSPTAA